MKAKGNMFKNKRVLIEYIHKERTEQKLQKKLAAQADARRQKNKKIRARRAARYVCGMMRYSMGFRFS